VIAVGVLIPFGRLDRIINGWIAAAVGLIFSGTLFAVVFAYGVRFIAVALQSVESGLHRTGRQVNEAARLLGASPIRTLVAVDMPMIRAYIVSAVILVFVDLLKELPLTLILRPFNFDTLATRTFGLAAQGRIPEAATPALIIVATGVLPVILLNKFVNRAGS
jgi:iron(III) transport system permease protein